MYVRLNNMKLSPDEAIKKKENYGDIHVIIFRNNNKNNIILELFT